MTLVWGGLDGNLLTATDNVTYTATTNASGGYSFASLPPGNFRVSTSGLASNLTQTYDLTGSQTDSTALRTLTAGENAIDVDFGYRGTASIGDTVWYDADGSQTQNNAEPGLAGVTVTLVWGGADGLLATAIDNVTYTTTTDSSGKYLFPGLPVNGASDEYRVTVTPLSGFATQTYDSDGLGTADTSTIDLAAGANDLNQDFGYQGVAGLGDFVWEDQNGNGRQDGGELGIDGIGVQLYDATGTNLLANTITSGGGAYSFPGLSGGSYQVRFGRSTATITYTRTLTDTAVGTDVDDSDANVGTGFSGPITVPGTGVNNDVDAGLYRPVTLGNRVYHDLNGDGVQDPGEPGISGVTVTVVWYGPDGVSGGGDDMTFTTTTDLAGLWSIANLAPGTFSVTTSTPAAAGFTTLTDSLDNGTPSATATVVISTTSGIDRADLDFGYRGSGSLGDTLWLDRNGNGSIDVGEPGLVGIGVTLTWYGQDGALGGGDDQIYTTTTGANGAYSFTNLPAGNFSVAITTGDLPSGLTPTIDLDGIATPSTTAVALTAGQTRLDADFGYRGAGSIGDLVWLDRNSDGTYQAGEPGLGGITVTLTWYGPDGALGGGDDATITQTTTLLGAYDFTGLPAGVYVVDVDQSGAPAGTALTTANDPLPVTLGVAQNYNTADFGFAGSARLGDRIWDDVNGNGAQDSGEPGLRDVTVTTTWAGPDGTFGTSDDLQYVRFTDSNGLYNVTNLPAGTFRVAVDVTTLPPGYGLTFDPDGLIVPSVADVTLTTGERRDDIDFGYDNNAPPVPGAVGDRIWRDTNGDGVQDSGESGIQGVTVRIVGAGNDGLFGTADDLTGIAPQTTDSTGFYQFTGLVPGRYRVTVDPAGIPAGLGQSYELDGTLNGSTEVQLLSGQTRGDVDFGYTPSNAGAPTGTIGDRVWNDADGDGVQDSGELGIGGVTVTLTWAGPDRIFGTKDDVVTTAVTDSAGIYGFDLLPSGPYTVTIDGTTVPGGLNESYELDGSRDGSVALELGIGQTRTDVDFGYTAGTVPGGVSSIGDTLWLDYNADGIKDAGEPGIPGVTVRLLSYGPDGTLGGGDDVTYSQVTDASGTYSFGSLPAGIYLVTVDGATLPAGLAQTYEQDGVRDGSVELTLLGEQNRDDIDFGYRGTGSLGDRVWNDADADRLQDAGETGIANVSVTLLGAGFDGVFGTADDLTRTTTTDLDGFYLFSNLPAGRYRVTLATAGPLAGLTETYELDGTMNGSSEATLGTGQTRLDIDFGYTSAPFGPFGSIGDTVWLDLDGDGAQNGEPGLPNVTVTLTAAGADNTFGTSDDVIFTQQTDAAGKYLFDGLPAGDYRVTVDAGTLPQGLTQTYDLDGALATPSQTTLTLAANEDTLLVDFGYRGTASLGDRVWNDLNGNEQQGSGEPGLVGITVTLTWTGGDGVLGTTDDVNFTTTTGVDGAYRFDGLPTGTYRVAIDTTTVPSGMQPIYDLDGRTDHLTDVGLTIGQARTDVDFGYVVPQINMAIVKGDAGVTATPGGTLIYTLSYSNVGNYVASGVTITETVPLHTRFNAGASTAGWSCANGAASGTTCTFAIGRVERAMGGLLSFAVTVDAPAAAGVDALSNTATIGDDGASGVDIDPANNSDIEPTPLGAAPDLQLTKRLGQSSGATQGSELIYELTYSNIGNQTATGVVITETVPLNTRFQTSGRGNRWSCVNGDAAGTTCTLSIGTLAVGASGMVTFAVRIDDPVPPNVMTIVNRAVIADDGVNGPDPTPNNNAGSALVPLNTTAIALASFSATRTDGGVSVRWVTGTELETFGYHLYRSSTGRRADAVRVTGALIPAQGGGQGGASYSWLDTTAEAGVGYIYWLEETETSGRRSEYGPVAVQLTPSVVPSTLFLPFIGR